MTAKHAQCASEPRINTSDHAPAACDMRIRPYGQLTAACYQACQGTLPVLHTHSCNLYPSLAGGSKKAPATISTNSLLWYIVHGAQPAGTTNFEPSSTQTTSSCNCTPQEARSRPMYTSRPFPKTTCTTPAASIFNTRPHTCRCRENVHAATCKTTPLRKQS